MNGKFVIFPNTGRIATQAVLDREQVPDYTLEVVAMDTSLLPLSSTTTVRVYVEDVNDNSPLFGQQNYSRTLALPVNTGTFIVFHFLNYNFSCLDLKFCVLFLCFIIM
ncbi:hypothetical protein DPMN_116232 [Dreissena polymorpha]|uniref:Cadherin domain-containing protein n=1 Tax=Dreissena polymorpha TaxID=45954 RepID=A0A9D4QTS2_DREPO|nr:hypothetical protein DPMN_116232 [Dreissena polymorpha]